MKKYQSVIEGVWIELVNVQLNEEQKILNLSRDNTDLESKRELAQWIKTNSQVEVDKVKLAELITFYNSIKPQIDKNDVYQLISIDITENLKGILNYRINGEHKQIRS